MTFKEKKLAEFDKSFDAHYFYEYPNEEVKRVKALLSESIEEATRIERERIKEKIKSMYKCSLCEEKNG